MSNEPPQLQAPPAQQAPPSDIDGKSPPSVFVKVAKSESTRFDVVCPEGSACRDGICVESSTPCPLGTGFAAGHCWVAAADCFESHADTCDRVGLTATVGVVDLEWTLEVMEEAAIGLGCNPIGDVSCCVEAFWVDDAGDCFTHNFGDTFHNWSGCLVDEATGIAIRTCNLP